MRILKCGLLSIAVTVLGPASCTNAPDETMSEVYPRWTAVQIHSAGAQDGPGALSRVFDVEVGPNGEMLVGQPTIGAISVFDSAGQLVRSVGRRGPGPGEFWVLGRMGWKADSLWVVDFGRVQLFDSALKYARNVAFPVLRPPPGIARIIPGPILADGSVLGISLMPDSGRLVPIVLLSESAEITDTLAHVPHLDVGVRVTLPDDERPANVSNPWIADPFWMSEQNGEAILIANGPVPDAPLNATFEITRIGINGDTLLHRYIAYVPRELEPDLVDDTYAEIVTRLRGTRSSVLESTIRRAVERSIAAPAYLPPISGMVLGRDGTIWLRREELRQDSVEWQVLDTDGGTLGTLYLPAGLEVMRTQRDRVWGIEEDSLDIPYVRVYEVRNGSG